MPVLNINASSWMDQSFSDTDGRKISYGRNLFIYLFGVLHRFQHCTGHITTGSWKGRGNQYIQFVRVLYCKLPTNGKQLLAFPLEAVPGTKARPQRWEARAYGRNSRKYKCEEINLACSGYLFKIIILYFFCRIFLQ